LVPREKEMQLIVLGMHRSGTSVLARLLNLMGVYFGPEGISTGANQENPKGFWERRDVRDLNDTILHSVGCDWNRVSKFDIASLPEKNIADFTKRASRLVLEMDAHRPWLLKEPRLCLLLPLWRKVLEVPVCIHIFRHPVEVASSLAFRNKMPMEVGLALWDRYVRSSLQGAGDLPRIVVSHRQLMLNPRVVATELFAQLKGEQVLGLRMPGHREIETFVRDDLYRERESHPDLEAYMKVPQVRLFRQLEAGEFPVRTARTNPTRATRQILDNYESTLPPLQLASKKESETVDVALRETIAKREQELKTMREAAEKLAADLKRRDMELARSEQRVGTLSESLGKLEAELEERELRLVDLSQLARTGQMAITSLEAEVAEKKDQLVERDGRLNKLREQHAQQAEALKQERDARMAAESKVAARFRETGQLTKLLMANDRALAQIVVEKDGLESRLSHEKHRVQQLVDENRVLHSLRTQLTKAGSEKAELRQSNARINAEMGLLRFRMSTKGRELACSEERLATIKNSLAWKLTTPIRAISYLLNKGNADPSPFRDELDAIRSSKLFDPSWYLNSYKDVEESGMDPGEHYLRHGAAEGRNPGPSFDTTFYLTAYPDVALSGINPLVHFIRHGEDEGRKTRSASRRQS
jgi:hypothetical protein